MSPHSPWNSVHRAATDRQSGAAEIARRAAEALAALPAEDLEAAVLSLVRGHPAMASLWRLGTETLTARDHAEAAGSFATNLASEQGSVAASAASLLAGEVLVHSFSSTVVAAVAAARVPALCARSEPGGEGVETARRLRELGIGAEVIDDEEALRTAATRTVVVGADAVGPGGLVNKVGTRALAEAAGSAGGRCYALTGTSKFLASDLPATDLFERVPLSLFTAIVTEDGPARPHDVAALLPRFSLHPRLAELLR